MTKQKMTQRRSGPVKKTQLYASLWASCDELRGGMDASQYKDYVLALLFIKYVSDKYAGQPFADIEVPEGASFDDLVALKGRADIGDQINKKIIAPLFDGNRLASKPDFNDDSKLGSGKEKVRRLTNLIAIFENPALDFSRNRAADDDLLGDAYEYLMRHFATQSGKSKGQFYTPAEVSRVIAQVIGIGKAQTSGRTRVYDPTCGSGSLLLKVADEARTPVSLYGQEKDSSTAGLARMNMILHANAGAEIAQGNTLTSPEFLDGDQLLGFDYVVANPPFSDKRWSTGLDPENDPYGRFDGIGIPPARQGDYAYLLHILKSMKSTATGACVLPHGVLFRGNAEAAIRKNLVRRGVIKAVIGLPANLFYGTGIPACIVVLDKRNAEQRKGIFMIDASAGFIKDGSKNRLRSRDIHRIVDTFRQAEDVPGYARLVPWSEIEGNDYNLNLPRYINSRPPEDEQDIDGHLNGGIPVAEVNALDHYWAVYPDLRHALFAPLRAGYVEPACEAGRIHSVIGEHPQYIAHAERMRAHFARWRNKQVAPLKALGEGFQPRDFIVQLSESLLAHYRGQPLTDAYAVYQHLMDYWADTMQDDAWQIAAHGWRAEPYRIIEKTKSGRERDRGWACDLVPKPLVVARWFAAEQQALDALDAELERLAAEQTELEEEHGGEAGALQTVSNQTDARKAWREAFDSAWQESDRDAFKACQARLKELDAATQRLAVVESDRHLQRLKNARGNINLKPVRDRLKAASDPAEIAALKEFLVLRDRIRDARKAVKTLEADAEERIGARLPCPDDDGPLGDLTVINQWLALARKQAEVRKQRRQADAELDAAALARYAELTEADIQSLVVEDKWLAALQAAVLQETQRSRRELARRVRELTERYARPLPKLQSDVDALQAKVDAHLEKMGFAWT